jgi:hypothetical protein
VFLLDPVLKDPNYIVSGGADTRVLGGAFLDLVGERQFDELEARWPKLP